MIRRIALTVSLLLLGNAEPGSVRIDRNGPDLKFTYAWPKEAALVPGLNRQFHAEAEAAYRKHLVMGREDRKIYSEQHRESVTDFYSKEWKVAGETAQILSLRYQLSSYTGGAHPNTSYGALIWQRRNAKELELTALFLQPRAFEALTRIRYCAGLHSERRKRRGGETIAGQFDQCPIYRDLAIFPSDADHNGRFDTMTFLASPYTAGPYSEGEYEVNLPVTSQLIAAIKPRYRASFERQRQ